MMPIEKGWRLWPTETASEDNIDSKDSGCRIEFVQEGLSLLENDQPVRAVAGFVSVGPGQSAVEDALAMFKKIKFPAAAFFLNSLSPFPAKALETFAEKVNKIVVIENETTPSLSKLLREQTWIKPVVMVPTHGRSITAEDIFGKEDWI